jgi:hypothetical protein
MRITTPNAATLYINNNKTGGDLRINTGSTTSNTYIDNGSLTVANGLAVSGGSVTLPSGSISQAAINGLSTTYLSQTDATTTYLTQTSAATTYLTQTNAATTYLSQTDAATTYLTIENYNTIAGTIGSVPIIGSISNLSNLNATSIPYIFLNAGWKLVLYSGSGYTGSTATITNYTSGIMAANKSLSRCTFYGYIIGSTLTVTTIVSGVIIDGMILSLDSGATSITTIVNGYGGVGSYSLSASNTWVSGNNTKTTLFLSSSYGGSNWGSFKIYASGTTERTVQNG